MSGCYCCWCCGGGGGGGCFFSNSGKILFVQFERKQINKILGHSIIEWRENRSILFSFYFQMKIWRWSAWFSFWIKSISSRYHIVLETTCVSHSATITVWLWVFISSIIHIFDAKPHLLRQFHTNRNFVSMLGLCAFARPIHECKHKNVCTKKCPN